MVQHAARLGCHMLQQQDADPARVRSSTLYPDAAFGVFMWSVMTELSGISALLLARRLIINFLLVQLQLQLVI